MSSRPKRSPHHKRHGHHQKHTPNFLKVYQPYLPMLVVTAVLLVAASLIHLPSSTSKANVVSQTLPGGHSVLAYATNINSSALLTYTNQRRATAKVTALTINSKLSQAAQAKANDMASRNYWAHNTPDGNPPWTFISSAGYSYNKAGENLACGFDASQDVITGWYDSPSHRDNLLHPDYRDVGFGIANAQDYNCGNLAASEQTIVVAMYAMPYTTSTSSPTTKKSTSTKPASVTAPVQVTSNPSVTPVTSHKVTLSVIDSAGKPASNIKVTLHSDPVSGYTNDKGVVTFNNITNGKHTITLEIEGAKSVTDIDLTDVAQDYKLTVISPELTSNQTSLGDEHDKNATKPQTINRLELLTNGNNRWVLAFLIIASVAGGVYVFVKHSLAAHRFIVKGERYILTHKLVDILVIVLCIALYFLTRTVGTIL